MQQTIQRIKNKTDNYTIVANEIFQRSDISARAKGIYAYIMTLPPFVEWQMYSLIWLLRGDPQGGVTE